jgi:PST family polysaccharide transporter
MNDSSLDPVDANLAGTNLKQAVRRGAAALATGQIASQLISILGLAVLLRLLAPNDYGLVGMVLPLVMFLRIFTTLGLNVATVQRAEIRPEDTSSLFWLNVLFGCATAAVIALIAPSMGWLYAKPADATLLRDLTWALAGTSIVAALGTQHQALLERRLQLGRLSAIRIVAQLAAVAAAIVAALNGWQAWALVVQQYVELALLVALTWWAEPWRPRLPRRGTALASQLRLGGFFAAAALVFYAADNLDRVLVGRLAGADAVGLYGQAYNIMIKPVYVVITPLVALMMTSLSRASEQPDTRRRLVVAYYRLLAVLLLPVSVGLVVVGEDVMQLLGGPAWREAGPLLSVLSLGMFGQATIIVGVPILTAANRGGRLLAAAMVVAIVLCTAYLAGWWCGEQFGEPTLGVAWGYSFAVLGVLALPYTWFCLRAADYEPRDVLAVLPRPAVAALVMGGAVWIAGRWLPEWSSVARLALLVPLGTFIYASLAQQELKWLINHGREMLAPRI